MFALRNALAPSRTHGLNLLRRAAKSSSMSTATGNAADAKAAPTKHLIEKKLTEGLAPTLLHVEDVSHQHAGHAGAPKGSSETHFNVIVVSDQFQGRSLLKRHRLVYDLLQAELQHGGVHALSLNTKTPAEVHRTDHGQDYICEICETNYGCGSDASRSKPLHTACHQQIKRGDTRFGNELREDQKDKPVCDICEAERERPMKQT